MASTIDKVKHVLHLDHDKTSTSHTHTTPTTGHSNTHTTGNTTGLGNGSTNAGPHSSNTANVVDPRVDSDRSQTYGSSNTHGTTGLTSNNNAHGTTGVTGNNYSGQTGTHSSNLANKLDPTVNTTTGPGGQHSGTHVGNSTGQHHTGTTGGISNSTNAGPHDSNLANKLNPLVDSDLDGRGNRHGAGTQSGGGILGQSGSHATPGSGTAQNTAGPHNSDALNKLDPRVDADLDGSKTYGGNKTHQ